MIPAIVQAPTLLFFRPSFAMYTSCGPYIASAHPNKSDSLPAHLGHCMHLPATWFYNTWHTSPSVTWHFAALWSA
jgi:hypothetical protein